MSERFFSKPKKDKSGIRIFFFALLAVLIFLLYYIAEIRIMPALAEIALSKLQDKTTVSVMNAVDNTVQTVKYSDIISLKSDAQGNIIALETNTALVNSLQAVVAKDSLDALRDVESLVISVPMGKLFSDYLFNDIGPQYNFRVLSTTSVNAKMENLFTDAGINQTRHQILLHLSVPIAVILRGKSYKDTIEVTVCVAETVLIGKVPNIYAVVEK